MPEDVSNALAPLGGRLDGLAAGRRPPALATRVTRAPASGRAVDRSAHSLATTQQVADLDRPARRRPPTRSIGARPRRPELVLHLHRLDDEQRCPASTASPAATATETTRPGMMARTSGGPPWPRSPSRGVARSRSARPGAPARRSTSNRQPSTTTSRRTDPSAAGGAGCRTAPVPADRGRRGRRRRRRAGARRGCRASSRTAASTRRRCRAVHAGLDHDRRPSAGAPRTRRRLGPGPAVRRRPCRGRRPAGRGRAPRLAIRATGPPPPRAPRPPCDRPEPPASVVRAAGRGGRVDEPPSAGPRRRAPRPAAASRSALARLGRAVPVLRHPAGRELAGPEAGVAGDEPVERQRRLDPGDLGLVERARAAGRWPRRGRRRGP